MLAHKRSAKVSYMTICQNGHLAVLLHDNGMNWLELWATSSELKTIAAMELPLQPTCICNPGIVIAVGSGDGGHCLITIRSNS